jgi:peroxiredoxin Q/BCP
MRFISVTPLLLALALNTLPHNSLAADPDTGKTPLLEGDRIAHFHARTHDGTVWKSEDHIGKKYVVVFFYPAAFTSNCTRQACLFRDHLQEIQQAGAEVVGVSGDSTDGLQLFHQHHSLNFPLLSDEQGAVSRLFGVPLREGDKITRSIDGIEHLLLRGVTASRWTFIIDPHGRIVARNTAVDPEKDATNVLNTIRRLTASTQ